MFLEFIFSIAPLKVLELQIQKLLKKLLNS